MHVYKLLTFWLFWLILLLVFLFSIGLFIINTSEKIERYYTYNSSFCNDMHALSEGDRWHAYFKKKDIGAGVFMSDSTVIKLPHGQDKSYYYNLWQKALQLCHEEMPIPSAILLVLKSLFNFISQPMVLGIGALIIGFIAVVIGSIFTKSHLEIVRPRAVLMIAIIGLELYLFFTYAVMQFVIFPLVNIIPLGEFFTEGWALEYLGPQISTLKLDSLIVYDGNILLIIGSISTLFAMFFYYLVFRSINPHLRIRKAIIYLCNSALWFIVIYPVVYISQGFFYSLIEIITGKHPLYGAGLAAPVIVLIFPLFVVVPLAMLLAAMIGGIFSKFNKEDGSQDDRLS